MDPASESYGLSLVDLASRMTLNTYFNRCDIVMHARDNSQLKMKAGGQAAFAQSCPASRIVAQQRLIRIAPKRGGRSLDDMQPLWRLPGTLHQSYILIEFSSLFHAGHRHGPRAHAVRHASCRQTKNRIQANLVAFLPVRTYKVPFPRPLRRPAHR